MYKKAFTLVELIVVITILAILWTVAFISLSWYWKEARDAKRMVETSSLLNKINIEQTKWIPLSDLITKWEPIPLRILQNDNPNVQSFREANFKTLKENENNFKDPSNKNQNYPLAYAIWWKWKDRYNFIQIATISEKENKTLIKWNYYTLDDDDAASLFNDWIQHENWWTPPIYDINDKEENIPDEWIGEKIYSVDYYINEGKYVDDDLSFIFSWEVPIDANRYALGAKIQILDKWNIDAIFSPASGEEDTLDFLWWSTNSNCIEKSCVNFQAWTTTRIKWDLNLYAVWTEKKYNVFYKANWIINWTDFTENRKFAVNDSFIPPKMDKITCKEENKSFIWWTWIKDAPAFTASIHLNFGKDREEEALYFSNKEDLILYPICNYLLHYNANWWAFDIPEMLNFDWEFYYEKDGNYQIKDYYAIYDKSKINTLGKYELNISREWSTFLWWSTDKNASSPEFVDLENIDIKKNMTLYAIWENINVTKQKFKVTYHGNWNTSWIPPTDINSPYEIDTQIIILEWRELSIDNQKFRFWNTKPNWDWDFYYPLSDLRITEDINLYAQYQKNISDPTDPTIEDPIDPPDPIDPTEPTDPTKPTEP